MVAFELIKCFAPAAAANLFFHSLFSLRMGRVIEREIAALAAPKGTVQWMKWIAVPAEAALFVELSWVVLAFGGLWAQQRSMAPPKGREQQHQLNENKWSWKKEWSEQTNQLELAFFFVLNYEMKWNNSMKKEGSGLIGFVSGARPKEPKAPRQAKAKHKTIPFFAAGHGKPAKKWSCCFAAEGLSCVDWLLWFVVGYGLRQQP